MYRMQLTKYMYLRKNASCFGSIAFAIYLIGFYGQHRRANVTLLLAVMDNTAGQNPLVRTCMHACNLDVIQPQAKLI